MNEDTIQTIEDAAEALHEAVRRLRETREDRSGAFAALEVAAERLRAARAILEKATE